MTTEELSKLFITFFQHLVSNPWQVKCHFPPEALRNIEKAIEASEGTKAKRLAHNHVQRAIDRVVDRINARANHEGTSQ